MSDLQKLAKVLIKKWYKVLSSKKWKDTYFSFSDWERIAYVQRNIYHIWYDFTKQNKPSRQHWTWFSVLNQADALLDNAKMALNAYCDRNLIPKELQYTNMTQFINYQKRYWKNYWELTLEEVENYIK